MKSRVVMICLFLGMLFSTGHAQTLTEVEKKYGVPMRAYPVSEHIWMTPEFGDDDQLCTARLYPKQIDAGNNYLWDTLPLWEVKEVIDHLAPASVRGKKKANLGFLFIGGMVFSDFDYENVRISFISSLRTRRPSGAVKSAAVVEDDEFPGQFTQSAQIVTVSWLQRKCSNK